MDVPVIVCKFNESGLLMYLNDVVPGWSPTRAIGSHISEITPPDILSRILEAMPKAKAAPRVPESWTQKATTIKGAAQFYFELVYMVGEFTLVSVVNGIR